jgi:F0F1-type ATP synthase epsilon subunit
MDPMTSTGRTLKLHVLTPEATRLRVERVRAVRATLSNRPICVLPGHAPLVGALNPGRLSYLDREGDHSVEVEAGILRVNGDTVTILTTHASARTSISERDGMQRQGSGRQEETPR